ncbi:MAG: 4'-phosphopantetheinyl transferase superfamily protein [Eubacteriales bacterium]|nr:4'-phosphopantetheinyl transferase superfamily protein [Eubacteriales bacterium]
MAVTSLVFENNPSKEARHAELLNSLREHFNNPDLDIEYTSKGKPVLKGINKYISVTTTENVMVCALSDTPIGIDGEHTARFSGESRTDYIGIAERFFTEEEADFIREGEDTGIRFAKIWIRKEAYCKYTGKGLSDFPNFSVTDGERFYGKINGIPVKRFSVNFPGSNEFLFAIVGDYSV